MNFSKTFKYIVFSTLLAIVLIVVGIFYFNVEESSPTEIESITLYDSKAKELVRVERKFDYTKNPSELIKETYEYMRTYSDDTFISNTIPAKIELLDFYINEDNILFLNLSENFKTLSPVEQNIATSSLVWNMTALDFVNKVAINIQYEPFYNDEEGTQILMDKSNVIINPNFSYTKGIFRSFALYFPMEDDAVHLYTEIRETILSENISEERAVLEELLQGPTLPNGLPSIPKNTKIGEIITYDKICQIDLSSEFITGNSKDAEVQIASVYSIVNSLTDLKHINKVQFLIDSKKTRGFKSIDLSQPLEKNISYIQ